MRVSNKITYILNFTALLCSLPIIFAGLWLSSKLDSHCLHFLLRYPILLLGLLVSLIGFLGAYFGKQPLLTLYLLCLAALIVLLLVLLVVAFVVTKPDGGYIVNGRSYKEYRLGGFAKWLRDYVGDSATWRRIRACLAESDSCPELKENYLTADQFFAARISPLQSGCCKPTTACGYSYVNPNLWINPVNPSADQDCLLWNNDQNILCYNCNSCKAGFLGNLRKEWRRANVILIVAVVVLIWVYVIACSAFKNAQTEELFRRYKQGWV